jgi:hypothetical protein
VQVIFIDHAKATRLAEAILQQNAIPATHSKGLLEQYVPASMRQDRDEALGCQVGDNSDDDAAAVVGMAAPSKL